MKKVIVIAGVITLIISGCSNLKKATYSDDVYVDPKEEQLEKKRLAVEKKKKEEEAAQNEAQKRADELAVQKSKDDANPAYKEPVYDKDDYYDYQYASRLRRFNNPVYGLSYYDNYYTNYYWYNNNPAYYGASIYTSYNWWGPSYSCGTYFGWGHPHWGYNPYGYNPWGYNPYGYNPYSYWNGYNQGYYNGYYNGLYGNPYGGGWGYFNSLDNNSGYGKATYAPRNSHGGTNSERVSNPGHNSNTEGYSAQYIQGVINQQENSPKFDAKAIPVKSSKGLDHSDWNNATNPKVIEATPNEPRTNPNSNNPKNEGINNPNNAPINNPKIKTNPGINPNESQPKQPPIENGPIKINQGKNPMDVSPKQPIKNEQPKGNFFEKGSQPNFNKGSSSPSPGGGGNSPRPGGNSGGGNQRPR